MNTQVMRPIINHFLIMQELSGNIILTEETFDAGYNSPSDVASPLESLLDLSDQSDLTPMRTSTCPGNQQQLYYHNNNNIINKR